MKQYQAKNILNIAIAGHSGSGKTSIAEAMLYLSGATDRFGKVGEGSTICDFDPEEIKRKITVATAVAPLEWKNHKINLIDAPGLFDFEGALCEAVRAADSVLIAVSGKSGVAVGTEKAVEAANKRGLAKIFFVNGLCDESARFYRVFEDLKASFGPSICPVVVPYIEDGKANIYINMLEYKAYDYQNGKPVEVKMPDMGTRLEGLRTAIYEAVAETSDEMFEKYFSGEQFTPEEVIVGVSKGVKSGAICPVFCGDALLMRGMEQFLDGLVWLAPSAEEKSAEMGSDTDGNPVELSVNESGATAAIVFKTVADPFIGKLSYLKVISGKVTTDTQLVNMRTGNLERIGKTVIMHGKKQEDAPSIVAGDIGAILKLQGTSTGDTLCAPARKVTLEGIEYPNPTLSMAVTPKNKGEEDKVAQGILRLVDEDPTIRFTTNTETHQMVLSGLGEQHLDIIVSKLKSKFGVDVTLQKPRVPYRETIRKKVQVQGRYKKQTGGHGQFGDIWVEFEPCDSDGLEFAERVVGGAVPKNFFPAVEKGLRECIAKGPLAGYPVVGLRATLYDGSYHPVDSSEMSFKMAANLAYKAGMPIANPVLLEPIGTLRCLVPDANMGDILGEVNKRRGRVLGMDPAEDGKQIVEAEVPMAEMHDFCTFVRQVTQGRGSFTFDFCRYEEAPQQVAQKVIEEAKVSAAEE
ncbi:elongation factor G [Caproiciproducens galactitolivorans]|uniref:Elongation factor G n=1 Tax=Caproiciproducens galactitolivorans TaxID=642589 RepID=A0ABT4BW01_9FIRM|nr:elongation factor G [Caproiciproducens galactitolivorans]MCY1715062.1 elongation factor G [Caproiciproducens galactitolivorans]